MVKVSDAWLDVETAPSQITWAVESGSMIRVEAPVIRHLGEHLIRCRRGERLVIAYGDFQQYLHEVNVASVFLHGTARAIHISTITYSGRTQATT